jgi:hypothetical protein
MSGQDFVREIAVDFPESETQHNVLSSLWARSRIDDLMGQDYSGMQQGAMKPELQETITNLGLEYRLMTQFTSFVAVEEMIVTDGGQPRRIDVPVEVPEGVNRASVVGEGDVVRVASGRQVQSLMLLSPGTVNYSAAEVVTVSADAPVINQSSSSVTTVIDGSVINPAAANKTAASRSRGGGSKAKVARGAGGGGSGVGGVGDFASKPAEAAPSAAELKRRDLVTKLHPRLLAVVDRLKKNDIRSGSDEAKFIFNGKAEIQIWLNDKSEETLTKLKELGFEVVLDPKSAKLIIGRLPIEKLEALAELKSIRYVAPQVSTN